MIINSASDWLMKKSTIVFYAENLHVHSRRKMRSYFFRKVRSRAGAIRSCAGCMQAAYDRISGVDAENFTV